MPSNNNEESKKENLHTERTNIHTSSVDDSKGDQSESVSRNLCTCCRGREESGVSGQWSVAGHRLARGTGEVSAVTTKRQCSLVVKTLDCQSKGRGFESRSRHLLCYATKEKNGNNLAHFCNFLMTKFQIDIFFRFYVKGFLL